MHIIRRTLWGVFSAALATLLGTAALTSFTGSAAAGASPPPTSQLPQVAVAQAAAHWLAPQITLAGSVDDQTPGTPDLSATVQTAIALAAANTDLAGAHAALSYLEANTDAYVTVAGSDGPGELATLILAAHALGVDPTQFGGTNLVTRLLATEQTSGPNAGRFGTDAQVPEYDADGYSQGLALAALHAAGVQADTPAISWLEQDQCPDGGWTAPDTVDTPCNGDPADYEGPDPQTTALAIEGLAAQGIVGNSTDPTVAKAIQFLNGAQDSDGGWGSEPNAADNPQSSDPDSTALVIQALLAAGVSPAGPQYTKDGAGPISTLLGFSIGSGPDAGAFFYPGGGNTAGNIITTYQAVPALMGLSFPFGPSGHSYWAVTASGSVYAFGDATSHGSLANIKLNAPIVGMAPTPDGLGYWLVASDGGVFTLGDATFYGSTGNFKLNAPIVGMAPTPDGLGYWLVASDGGVFSFGSAAFAGSTGAQKLNAPIVGMAPTPDGLGYWLVASDGGVFSFGDAAFHGSTGAQKLNAPVVGMAPTPDGLGYWLVASDGGVFTFGDAAFHGSTGAIKLNKPIVSMTSSPDGGGYWLVASDGGVFTFGDAVFSGSAAAQGITNVVAVTTSSP